MSTTNTKRQLKGGCVMFLLVLRGFPDDIPLGVFQTRSAAEAYAQKFVAASDSKRKRFLLLDPKTWHAVGYNGIHCIELGTEVDGGLIPSASSPIRWLSKRLFAQSITSDDVPASSKLTSELDCHLCLAPESETCVVCLDGLAFLCCTQCLHADWWRAGSKYANYDSSERAESVRILSDYILHVPDI